MTNNEATIAQRWFEEHYPDWSIHLKDDYGGYSVSAHNKENKQDKISIIIKTASEWLQDDRSYPKLSVNVFCNYQLVFNLRGSMVTETLTDMVSRFKGFTTSMLPKGSLVAVSKDFKELTRC